VDVAVRKYAPLPASSLTMLVARMRYAAPQWSTGRKRALQRARVRLAHERVDGVEWYWPADEAFDTDVPDTVRLLAPFDPVVWDRRRFEQLWDWAYRFEAYTPVRKRKLGYYALPLLWRDRVIGWGNITQGKHGVTAELGYARSRPRDRQFTRALDEEMDRMRTFLGHQRT
jgi:uncharacterized protein YcaQ